MVYPKINIIFYFLLASLVIIGVGLLAVFRLTTPKIAMITVKQQIIRAEIADTAASRYQGLSGRRSLCLDCGMIFIFPDQAEREFVMRRMKFPLDIIFINNNKIIKIAEKLAPEGNDPVNIYKSSGPADKVLEVIGGYAAQKGLMVGDSVLINKEIK